MENSGATSRKPVATLATALVTGAAGFLGSHLVDLLLREGWRVIGVDNFDPAYPERMKRRNIVSHLRHPAYRLIEADVRSLPELLERVDEDIHVAVHMAARTSTQAGIRAPLDAAAVNFQGTLNLLEFCRQRRVRQFVLTSCGNVYGSAAMRPWSEETVPRPVNPLDGARVAAEQFGICYSRLYNMQFISVRLFNVYGPRDQPASFISELCAALMSGKVMTVPGDVEAMRDFTYVSDAAYALRLAMSFGANPSEVFNVGSGEAISISRLVTELEAVSARRANVKIAARDEGELIDIWGNTLKARRLLGFVPKVTLREGLARFLEWQLGQNSDG